VGLARLFLLTASEYMGIMFACYIILHTSEGEALAKLVTTKQQGRYLAAAGVTCTKLRMLNKWRRRRNKPTLTGVCPCQRTSHHQFNEPHLFW
jgi:hypothetical protein